jgi:mannose-6-phosphate isomerase-like protein (cupin superfamily)
MKGFTTNIEKSAQENSYFRKVLYTGAHSQLVMMSLLPKEDIGEEVHMLDQFIRCEEGGGVAILDGVAHDMKVGIAVHVPAGAKHNITNTSQSEPMKLSTLYAPPNHRDGIVHKTKAEAQSDTEHFDGRISE